MGSLNPITSVLLSREKDTQKYRGDKGHVKTGRDWSDAAISQGIARRPEAVKRQGVCP